MSTLQEMNVRLRRIFRGEERHGEGPAAEQARRYRLSPEVLSATVAQAKLNSADVPREPVDLLVSLSGFSPETTILAFELLQPNRLMIIGSESTEKSFDQINEVLKLPLSRLIPKLVDPIDPLRIYQFVREAAQSAPSRDGSRPRIMIDITGGKKVMSACAALAAAQLDLPLCYIDSRFDSEFRQSVPGTERLVVVKNPTALFGDRDLDAAQVAFRHGAYSAAHDRFAEIADAVYEPAQARFMRDLSNVYQAWCDLDLGNLGLRVGVMRSRLTDPGFRPLAAISRRLGEQLRFLDELVAAPDGPLGLLNFYLLGEHYRRLGRHDFAALLYYRTIEGALTQRLTGLAPGFSCRQPAWSLLCADEAELSRRYRATATVIYRQEVTALPLRVALMDSALLLYVVDDPLLKLLDITNEKGLRHLSGLTDARNQSVLAHGTSVVTPDLSTNLGNHAVRTLRAFWALGKRPERLDDLIKTLQFVDSV
jgi:hypothetical protein